MEPEKITDENGNARPSKKEVEMDALEDSSDDELEDKLKEKNSFFLEPPPQVHHQSFATMNLSRPLLKAITELGFLHPTPIQASTIPVALMGKDVCACAATGTGKTAAFMLPILERLLYKPLQNSVSRVLVLTPTRELAIQIHSVSLKLAKHTNITVCLAAGGLDLKTQEAALRNRPDIIVATPGRLVDHLHNTPTFDLQAVEILVLDEADRMLDEHFKDQMDEIIKLSNRGRQTMLFSATMTDEVEELVSLSLNQPIRLFVDSNTDVAYNLTQEFIRIRQNREDDRLAIVTALCSRTFSDHCLVFAQTKWMAHKLRIILGLLGLNVEELHGNLTQLQRLESLRKFKDGEVDFLVCTDLAARGLDITGVKTVINFSMPTNVKQYVHRVGRTARAGKSGRSVTLVGEKERKSLKEVVKNSRTQVKSRIIPPEVIEKYSSKVEALEADIKDILKQENEEKEMRISEMEMNKAKNLLDHEKEIYSRPARVWFQDKNDLKRKGNEKGQPKKRLKKETRQAIKMTEEEKSRQREMDFIKREAKRSKRPKKLSAFPPERPEQDQTKKSKPKAGKTRSFDQELTDISKKALKQFRSSDSSMTTSSKKSKNSAVAPQTHKGAKGKGKFKSKKKFKRR
ncbi:probable ATP-dependent RNA helicase DDX27 [Exaiptasia diaphana]|uniref:RNA helicase n=1 Tax=Exaiptasia diaphana TaxID=2652724 RepID=A0A913XQT5_EXADI|nr:probable ATP-dependent RNA helicase DDX27 [Exaiptasia diaphana]KXJ25263.1 putative ATP-dependent RNA helicase DDX27 [Exaiptasia diaphana]